MKKAFILVLSIVALVFNISCSPASPKLMAEPKIVYDKIDIKGDSIDYTPVVDILFVVDRSGSMAGIQSNLSSNIDLFLNGLSSMKVDYHIGVITSDGKEYNGQSDPGCIWCSVYPNTHGVLQGTVKYVTPTTPNGISILKQNILVGTDGDSTEQFFGPIVKALSPEMTGPGGVNSGFIRDNAYFAVVFITDADDQSPSGDTFDSTFNFLVNLKKSKSKVLSYGILIPAKLGNALPLGCTRSGEPLPWEIENLLQLTINNKSNEMNLCDPQFGVQLTKFSKDLVKYLVGTIPLNKFPLVSTLQVFYGGKEIPADVKNGWYYDPKQNAVIMGDNVVLDDEGDGSGLKIKFDAIPLQ
jgi:hypothetical protein